MKNQINTPSRVRWTVLVAVAASALLNGCGGGGGDDCEITSQDYGVFWTPSIPVTGTVAPDALTYKLNQRNTWTMQTRGLSAACMRGLKVQLRDPVNEPLPVGFTLDASTGTIDSGLMTRHIEGTCAKTVGSTTTLGGSSVNRICPAEYTLSDARYVVVVTSDRYNTGTPIPRALVFRPAQ